MSKIGENIRMLKNVGVHIKVSDFKKSLAFYTALGFKKVFEYGPDKTVKEAYNGTVFEIGGTKLEIADGHRAVKPEVFAPPMPNSKISSLCSYLVCHGTSNKKLLAQVEIESLT